MNKIDSTDASHVAEKQMEAHDEVETSLKQQSNGREKSATKELQVSSKELIPIDQLKEFIMRTIQNKLGGSSKSSMTYTKSYTQRIDNLKMPVGYQPLKFQQFDSKVERRTVIDYINWWRNLSLNCKDHLSETSAMRCIQELMIDATTGHEALSFMDGSSGYNQIFMALKDEELKAFPTPKGIYCYKVIAFGLKNAGKFLGFIVRHRGIEIEQTKIDAILKMPEPWNIHELKSLQGKLAYLRSFISNLAGRCQPFSRIIKKGVLFEWDEACQNTFRSIKSYLMKPPVLVAPVIGHPLILYIATQECSVGALLAQENDERKESALYYLSRRMTPNKLKYSPIEKIYLALIFAIQKLKHYFQAHTVRLVSKANSLKYVMSKPVLSDRLARWYLQLHG
ncbi:UNVERIFIED_CONTAM: hypothetical protein Slati_0441500 [Sesamum latifolium]|uniref:Reverse transcriptase/retrotransposon-derived protein RNase H-like domain-containing protein n=1 Tax=Sesamum latifolium TaxID=2727402 RepID=A0AAW2XVJ7_9LAMI